jgi:hypothetical protein
MISMRFSPAPSSSWAPQAWVVKPTGSVVVKAPRASPPLYRTSRLATGISRAVTLKSRRANRYSRRRGRHRQPGLLKLQGRALPNATSRVSFRDNLKPPSIDHGSRSWFSRNSILRAQAGVERDLEEVYDTTRRNVPDVVEYMNEKVDALRRLLARRGRNAPHPQKLVVRARKAMLVLIDRCDWTPERHQLGLVSPSHFSGSSASSYETVRMASSALGSNIW